MMFDRSVSTAYAALNNGSVASRENARIQKIREALGAVAVGEPAVFWLYQGQDTNWYVRREGDPEEHGYESRDQALQCLHLGAIRCASYCLFVQESSNGRFTKESFNWPANCA